MSKEVTWTKIILERFIEQAMLTEQEEIVIRTRIAGWSITEQSMKLGMSISTVNRIIKRLKIKYDAAQKYDPILPPRKHGYSETFKGFK